MTESVDKRDVELVWYRQALADSQQQTANTAAELYLVRQQLEELQSSQSEAVLVDAQ